MDCPLAIRILESVCKEVDYHLGKSHQIKSDCIVTGNQVAFYFHFLKLGLTDQDIECCFDCLIEFEVFLVLSEYFLLNQISDQQQLYLRL